MENEGENGFAHPRKELAEGETDASRFLERWLSVRIDGPQAHADLGAYLAARERYEERFGDRAYFMENLMVTLFFFLAFPNVEDPKALWKGYVNFCELYAMFRFMAVMSCREGAPGGRDELFRLLVTISRALIHD